MEQGQPEHPQPAATVILTRQLRGELQVYLLKRNVKSRFMAGKYVFPGGIVESGDRDLDRWMANIDLDPIGSPQHFAGGLPPPEALAYGITAIRETFEEAGVILAGRSGQNRENLYQLTPQSPKGRSSGGVFMRRARSEGWILKLSALHGWSCWVTPEKMNPRYDTRFFLAAMPPDQSCRPDRIETVHGLWISPRKGLAANLSGEIPLSPPTLVTLHELLRHPNLDEAEDASGHPRWPEMRLPRLVRYKDEAVIVQPWDPQYHRTRISFNADALSGAVLPVGEPFSRLWQCDGIWKPVKG